MVPVTISFDVNQIRETGGGEARDDVGCFWLVAAAVPHLGCDGIAEVMEFRPELQNDNQST